MRMQRLAIALTAISLVLLLLNLAQVRSTTAQTVAPMLRARALELVDDRNVVRVLLNVKDTLRLCGRPLRRTAWCTAFLWFLLVVPRCTSVFIVP